MGSMTVAVAVWCLAAVPTVEVTAPEVKPAQGSVVGPWAFVDLHAGASAPTSPPFRAGGPALGAELSLVGGFGAFLGPVRLSPTASFSLGLDSGASVQWSTLDLALAAPDLLNDQRFTGLRLTPVLGLAVPTSPAAFLGRAPLTTVSLGAQLERRFGRVELAWRITGGRFIALDCPSTQAATCEAPPTWLLDQRLLVEAWVLPTLSFAAGVSLTTTWLAPFPTPFPECTNGGCSPTSSPMQDVVKAQLQASWAFHPRVGLTASFGASRSEWNIPGLVAIAYFPPQIFLEGGLAVWFRTDAVLARNWLER